MRKRLLFVLFLCVNAFAFAQTQIATLNHNDSISVYYGVDALRSAHSAAVAGDIITLSPGTFNACVIKKPITLRGAGCENDSVTLRTEIQPYFYYSYPNYLTLNIPEDSLYHFTMEGIHVASAYNGYLYIDRAYNPQFIKCKLNRVESPSSYREGNSVCNPAKIFVNATFIDCNITNIDGLDNTTNKSFNFVNSVVQDLPLSNVFSYNSYIILGSSSSYNNLYAYNSIVEGYSSTSANGIGSTSLLQNCIAIRKGSNYVNLLMNMSPYNNTNIQVMTESEVFENEGFYILKEEIANSFLGDDGTEVGIYGGLYPYNTKPNYMVVKRYDVADKSVNDELGVEIEIVTEQ